LRRFGGDEALLRQKKAPHLGERGFSGRDMPHNAEGGPDRSTNREVCSVTMTGALCGFPRCQRRLVWIKRRLVGLQVKSLLDIGQPDIIGPKSPLIAIEWLQR
jgi:hypothetical protein